MASRHATRSLYAPDARASRHAHDARYATRDAQTPARPTHPPRTPQLRRGRGRSLCTVFQKHKDQNLLSYPETPPFPFIRPQLYFFIKFFAILRPQRLKRCAVYISLTPELSMPVGLGVTKPADVHTAARAMFSSAQFVAEFGDPEPANKTDVGIARDVLRDFAAPADVQRSATAVYLRSLLAEYDHEVVETAVQIRQFVTNSLIEEAAPGNKNRIRALELLGKISEVGLFTERTEITVRHQSADELETKVRDKLAKLMGMSTPQPIEDAIVRDAN